jgi:putative glycosyltransferase (TIGR04348 family)
MKMALVTPAPPSSLSGNRATARRWSRLLREAGHKIDILEQWGVEDRSYDLMIALHAWRSAASIAAFANRFPDRALIIVLTGTDIYRFQHTHPKVTRMSLAYASALIGLHANVSHNIPSEFHTILHIVYQSALPLATTYRKTVARDFTLCVVGHLREEKDSLRAAEASRLLPVDSRIRIVQAGRAHTSDWAVAAQAQMSNNERYSWLGEVSQTAVRHLYARSQAMVITSVMEGGANVVSEACVAGLPIIASNIPGNTGLLGQDYPGLFPTGDSVALAAMMTKLESDFAFRSLLTDRCRELASRYTPEAEKDALLAVIHKVSGVE